jgi:hypothetical protein
MYLVFVAINHVLVFKWFFIFVEASMTITKGYSLSGYIYISCFYEKPLSYILQKLLGIG